MRRLAAALAFAAVAAACTGATGDPPSTPGTPIAIPTVGGGGADTARRAIADLCVAPDLGTPEQVEPGPLPAQIQALIGQVETARGRAFLRPPAAEAITDEVMDRKLEESFDVYYPKDAYDRRTIAWRTIGVIPRDADLLEVYRTYLTGQVIGFYDPQTGELVYLGEGDDLGLEERLVLSHELTHALDDQHFDLKRLDRLVARCADERFTAALGLVEGSAQHVANQVALSDPLLDTSELAEVMANAQEAQEALRDVPPFVQALQTWPYVTGTTFVDTLAREGGTAAIDRALTRPPVSTEQVIHPERFPADVPTPVDVPDLSGALGAGWGDLDAMTVGELWLATMLDLRLPPITSANAAAGWDGGVYRAWTDGEDVVVVLQTAWDAEADAEEFLDAMNGWITESELPYAEASAAGDEVRVVFATSPDLVATATDALPS